MRHRDWRRGPDGEADRAAVLEKRTGPRKERGSGRLLGAWRKKHELCWGAKHENDKERCT